MAYLRLKLARLETQHQKSVREYQEVSALWQKQLASSDAYVEMSHGAQAMGLTNHAQHLLEIAQAHLHLAARSEKLIIRLLRRSEQINTRRVKTERKLANKENN